jgi:hypothetical protein
VSPDPWLDYSGPLCDDPAERELYAGLGADHGDHYDDMSPDEQRAAARGVGTGWTS